MQALPHVMGYQALTTACAALQVARKSNTLSTAICSPSLERPPGVMPAECADITTFGSRVSALP